MSIFGQVWLWSLLAFVVGALLTWLVLVLPARKRIRGLESRLATGHAEKLRVAVPPSAASISPLAPPAEPEADKYQAFEAYEAAQQPSVGESPADPTRYLAAESHVEAEPLEFAATEYIPLAEPTPEREPGPLESAVTESLRHPEPIAEEPVASRSESLFQLEADPAGYRLEPNWFDRELEPERAAFEEPATQQAAEQETPVESTQVLPKRQRRESPRGGFESPTPIQPSMRAVERREPASEVSGGHSGSLFEPAPPPGRFTTPPAPEPPPARQQVAESVPPGPFGPGSAMPRPGGGRPSEEFGVKASVTALRYCTEESVQFPRMVAEVWFRTKVDAERVGFRPLV